MNITRLPGRGHLFILMLCAALVSLLVGRIAAADPPRPETILETVQVGNPVLGYQGRLLDPATGAPKPNGAYTVQFTLYDSPGSRTPLWTETKSVAVNNGLFSTLLGDTTALNPALFDGSLLWLGVTVGADPEATPRQPVASVGNAVYARNAGTLGGQLPNAFAPANHFHDGSEIRSGTVAETRIDAALTRDSEVMTIVKANDGAGSGVDADLLDGQSAAAFAAASHTHSAADLNAGTLSTDRYSAYNDLVAESKIGTGSAQVAAGNHTHTGADIVDASIATADLANSAVTTAKLADGSVTAAKLAANVAPKFISLTPYSAFLTSGAVFDDGFGPNAGIELPDSASGTPGFAFGFTIPPDYVAGTTITLRLIWHTNATSCNITLAPNWISVARAGRTHIVGGSASSGLDAVGGSTLSAPSTANQSSSKDYSITSPSTSTTLQPGDSVMFGLYRNAGGAADTCAGTLYIQGVRLSY